jgi:hypothetical protein
MPQPQTTQKPVLLRINLVWWATHISVFCHLAAPFVEVAFLKRHTGRVDKQRDCRHLRAIRPLRKGASGPRLFSGLIWDHEVGSSDPPTLTMVG